MAAPSVRRVKWVLISPCSAAAYLVALVASSISIITPRSLIRSLTSQSLCSCAVIGRRAFDADLVALVSSKQYAPISSSALGSSLNSPVSLEGIDNNLINDAPLRSFLCLLSSACVSLSKLAGMAFTLACALVQYHLSKGIAGKSKSSTPMR